MSLIYAPVYTSCINYPKQTLTAGISGLCTARLRDGSVHVPHHPTPLHRQEEAVHVHLRESSRGQTTIWLEGRLDKDKTHTELLLSHGQITFIFILILFVDSVNRVYRVQVELAQAKYQGGAAG